MWTTEKELKLQLEKMWDKGIFLSAVLSNSSLFPLKIKLKKPNSKDITDNFSAVRLWVNKIQAISSVKIKWKIVSHRIQGEQQLPDYVYVENIQAVLSLLKKEKSYVQFLTQIEITKQKLPDLLPFLEKYPLKVLSLYDIWNKLLAVVYWRKNHLSPNIYLRQVDIPDIHSKFIESNKTILSELFDFVLPKSEIKIELNKTSQFSERYGFREKPIRIRFRNLDPRKPIFPFISSSDLTLDLESFCQLMPQIKHIIIVENEINYLALPNLEDCWAIFGAGYGWSYFQQITWLKQCNIYYWGDIDTHGFAILNQLRHYLPQTKSFLMEQNILLEHREFWSSEAKPYQGELTNLTEKEQRLFQKLQSNELGKQIRLEQEFIAFSTVEKVLSSLFL